MYSSPDEDRSDLFLAGAVYVLGPQLLGVLLARIPFPPAALSIVRLVVILLTTVAVPLWLLRYRKQRLADFGSGWSVSGFGLGLLASVPIAVGYVVAALLGGMGMLATTPAVDAVTNGSYVNVALSVISGLCVGLLAVYTTVKARTAFRADPSYLKPTAKRLARFAAIGAAVAAGLLLLTVVVRGLGLTATTEIVLAPLGLAGAGLIVFRSIRGAQLSSRATLLTPMVLLAIGSFVIFGQATDIVFGLWRAALLAGVGLVIGMLVEGRRSAWAPIGFVLGVTLLTPLLL